MASTALTAEQGSPAENRRLHARHRIGQLAYVACGPDNGGILLDISEGGLSFQGVGAIEHGQFLDLKFMLPAVTHPIEAAGQVIWLNGSGKGGGLQFVGLPDAARRLVMGWIAAAQQPGESFPHRPGVEASARIVPVELSATMEVEISNSELAAGLSSGAKGTLPGSEALSSRLPVGKTPFLDSLRMSKAAAEPLAEDFQSAGHIAEAHPQPQQTETQPPEPDAKAWLPEDAPAAPLSSCAEPQPAQEAAPGIEKSIREAVLSDPRPNGGGTGVFKIALSAVLGGALAFGAIVGVRAVRRANVPATRPSAARAARRPGGAVGRDFQVQVVDGSNPPWTLKVSAGGSPVAGNASQPATTPPVSREATVEKVQTPARAVEKSRVSNPHPVPPQWAFRPPSPPKHTALPADLRAPAIANAALPSGTALDVRGMGAGVTQMPAPPARPVSPRLSSFQQAVLVQRVAPAYSPLALQQSVEGTVRVHVTIDKNGVPQALRVISGDGRLANSAIAAIRRWRYRPALLNGKPVETQTEVHVEFRLSP
jgi:TonB family protein